MSAVRNEQAWNLQIRDYSEASQHPKVPDFKALRAIHQEPKILKCQHYMLCSTLPRAYKEAAFITSCFFQSAR